MSKIVLRLLHFLIFYINLALRITERAQLRMRATLRYYVLSLIYFTDERMVEVFTTRMTKKLDHASIVINRFSGTR